jgi:hypothetical protein
MRLNSKGENPIYLRLTVDGKRKEKSLNRSIKLNKWNSNKQRGKGSNEIIKTLNEYLNSGLMVVRYSTWVQDFYNGYQDNDFKVNADIVRAVRAF